MCVCVYVYLGCLFAYVYVNVYICGLWYVRAGVCCALAAYVFTRASICVYICISRWAFVVLYLWFSQWMCKTLRAVIVHMWECAGGLECGFLFSPLPSSFFPQLRAVAAQSGSCPLCRPVAAQVFGWNRHQGQRVGG